MLDRGGTVFVSHPEVCVITEKISVQSTNMKKMVGNFLLSIPVVFFKAMKKGTRRFPVWGLLTLSGFMKSAIGSFGGGYETKRRGRMGYLGVGPIVFWSF